MGQTINVSYNLIIFMGPCYDPVIIIVGLLAFYLIEHKLDEL